MSIGEAVRDQLLATTAVADLCNQIYPDFAPADVTFPVIVTSVDSINSQPQLGGAGAYKEALVEVNCYSLTKVNALAIAAAVQSALVDFRGTLGTTTPAIDCDHIRLDRYGPEDYETETLLFRVPVLFFIGFEEST